MRQITVYEMTYRELDHLVRSYYGQEDWESVAHFEWHNGEAPQGTADPALGETDDLRAFRSGGRGEYLGLGDLLSGLAAGGLLPAGAYLITVYW